MQALMGWVVPAFMVKMDLYSKHGFTCQSSRNIPQSHPEIRFDSGTFFTHHAQVYTTVMKCLHVFHFVHIICKNGGPALLLCILANLDPGWPECEEPSYAGLVLWCHRVELHWHLFSQSFDTFNLLPSKRCCHNSSNFVYTRMSVQYSSSLKPID